MRLTNSKIKKYLIEEGFTNLYFFPHLRHMKDYCFEDEEFDGMGWKDNLLYLFQFKTNQPASKKTLDNYKKITSKNNVALCWITKFDKRKLTKTHPNEIEIWTIT